MLMYVRLLRSVFIVVIVIVVVVVAVVHSFSSSIAISSFALRFFLLILLRLISHQFVWFYCLSLRIAASSMLHWHSTREREKKTGQKPAKKKTINTKFVHVEMNTFYCFPLHSSVIFSLWIRVLFLLLLFLFFILIFSITSKSDACSLIFAHFPFDSSASSSSSSLALFASLSFFYFN